MEGKQSAEVALVVSRARFALAAEASRLCGTRDFYSRLDFGWLFLWSWEQ